MQCIKGESAGGVRAKSASHCAIMCGDQQLAVDVQDLNFSYGGPPILQNLNFQLERGQRCLLVGANGAGKTTLLRILAGKRKVRGNVSVLGKNAFLDAPSVKGSLLLYISTRIYAVY